MFFAGLARDADGSSPGVAGLILYIHEILQGTVAQSPYMRDKVARGRGESVVVNLAIVVSRHRAPQKQRARHPAAPQRKTRSVESRSGLLRLAAEECRHIEVVRGDFVADVANILLHLVHDVGQLLLLGLVRNFAAGLPGFRQE